MEKKKKEKKIKKSSVKTAKKEPKNKNLTEDERKILKYLSRHDAIAIPELAKLLDRSEVGIIEIIISLRGKGFDIYQDRAAKSVQLIRQMYENQTPLAISQDGQDGLGYRVAVITETRFGHRNQQLTLLHTAYKLFEKMKVNFVLHGGNLVAGMQPKRHQEEVFLFDAEAQLEYVAKHYPKSSNFRTYIIAGQTDLTFKTKDGYNILRAVCQERDDLIYRGDESAKFLIRRIFEQELMHPATDNVPYAKTYTFQRILEQIIATLEPLVSNGGKRPNMVLAGGYHTPGLLPSYSDIDGILLPSFISQTPRQKRKGIAPTIGFWIIDIQFDPQTGGIKNIVPALYDWTHYQMRQDYLEDVNDKTHQHLNKDEKEVLSILAEGPQSCGELSRRLNRNKDTVLKLVNRLMTERKMEISIPSDTKQVTWDRKLKSSFSSLPNEIVDKMFVKSIKIAEVSDPHLCSKDQQISLLKKAYQIGDEENVDLYINPGDVSDGCGSVGYRSHGKDVFLDGYTEQKEYIIANYPKSAKGKKTIIIPGNHDWWDFESFGGNIVKEICEARADMQYGDYPSYLLEHNGFKILVFHPGGGSSYALSYQIQKHIINQLRNKKTRVDAIFFGHYHKALYMVYAGVHAFLGASLKGYDEFHEKLSLPQAIGMWIVEFTKDENGRITRVVPDYRDLSSLVKEKDY